MIIAVDFDGTCVDHCYPKVGEDVPGAVAALRELVRQGHRIVLWTMRSGRELEDAIHWFARWDIPLFGVNHNPEQASWSSSPKAYANRYIDDAAVGCPLRENPRFGGRPYVNWVQVMVLLGATKPKINDPM